MAKLNSSFPCHLTVMSWKIDFVIKGNEKVKFMLNWIYFSVFIDFPQGPNPRVRSECSLKKIRTCSVSCCSSSHCMRNSQINSRRGIDQIQVIQILLDGGLFPIKITCFDSCRMTYFLSLSLPGINGQGSKSRLCTPRIARRTISGTETELFVPIRPGSVDRIDPWSYSSESDIHGLVHICKN